MLDQNNQFVIENYGKKSTFASFLPGISGPMGIPLWCYYVNRGQGVSSFGVQDKDHAILGFEPAHLAYRNVSRTGFRTFVKVDGQYRELFSDEDQPTKMKIGMNTLTMEEKNENGLFTRVDYFVLPNEAVAGLVRKVTITNTGREPKSLEVLDGLAEIVPCGVNEKSLRLMTQTAKAWMQVLHHEEGVPYFTLRASMEDTAEVTEIRGGNFAFAFHGNGGALPVMVDGKTVFSYDNALRDAVAFRDMEYEAFCSQKQFPFNDMPCGLFAYRETLGAGKSLVLYEIYGNVDSYEELSALRDKYRDVSLFEKRYREATAITEELTDVIRTKTGDPVFDLYSRQTYLDNVMRGGVPIILGGNKIFYLYSRKHGDTERDYNFFQMTPEQYSQGNGNFRDVNQNRRCDVLFSPYVKDDSIKMFYNLIQIDGYNPLGIEQITYYKKEDPEHIFTPGSLLKELRRENPRLSDEELEGKMQAVIAEAECERKSDFKEGYWTDHWTYNLDLVESYLAVYPEQEEALLFFDETYTYRAAEETILPRSKRYVETEKGIRQYRYLEKNPGNSGGGTLKNSQGAEVRGNLIEKMILLCAVKFAALDAYGMGIEMEGGKPGWYDALNGLPGLMGSSVSETLELERNLIFVIEKLKTYGYSVALLSEVALLLRAMDQIIEECRAELTEKEQVIHYWNSINDAKERYRESTRAGVDGAKEMIGSAELISILEHFLEVTERGIRQALRYGNGICATYFCYDVVKYSKDGNGIWPEYFSVKTLPYFLEGPVHFMKLPGRLPEKEALYDAVRKSGLYDRKLSMYKVNASLEDSPIEIGRCRAFSPGWLENESIWLHMEYKYLLELLKTGMYDRFLEDFHKAAIPFLDSEVYGRSLLENSSFIASSANPDERIHGKGFVARLSGSTAEFLQMWQIMMFGRTPFTCDEYGLKLELQPLLPDYLVGTENTVEAMFLGTIPVTYHLSGTGSFLPGEYKITQYRIVDPDGMGTIVSTEFIRGPLCGRIRSRNVKEIEVWIKGDK